MVFGRLYRTLYVRSIFTSFGSLVSVEDKNALPLIPLYFEIIPKYCRSFPLGKKNQQNFEVFLSLCPLL